MTSDTVSNLVAALVGTGGGGVTLWDLANATNDLAMALQGEIDGLVIANPAGAITNLQADVSLAGSFSGTFAGDASGALFLNGANVNPNSIPIGNLPQIYSGTPDSLTVNAVGQDWYLYVTGGGNSNGTGLSFPSLIGGSNATVTAVGTNWVVSSQTDTNVVGSIAAYQSQIATQALARVVQPTNANLTAWSGLAPASKQNALGFEAATNGGPIALSQLSTRPQVYSGTPDTPLRHQSPASRPPRLPPQPSLRTAAGNQEIKTQLKR